jgi:hypothetical protein
VRSSWSAGSYLGLGASPRTIVDRYAAEGEAEAWVSSLFFIG